MNSNDQAKETFVTVDNLCLAKPSYKSTAMHNDWELFLK
jgi:hypothetical protein